MIGFWTFALGLAILLYVTLDGFDLGIGMLFPFAPNETARRHMLAAISPVWDGNETWLIVAASILFGIFPLTYATLLSALYLPLLVMLAALIFRGLAFEFRYKSFRLRRFWDVGFVGGSLLAGFIQGTAVGALVEGLPIQDGRYVGGPFGWVSPFALLCGLGLCAWLLSARRRLVDLQDSGGRAILRLPAIAEVNGGSFAVPCRRVRACARAGLAGDASLV